MLSGCFVIITDAVRLALPLSPADSESSLRGSGCFFNGPSCSAPGIQVAVRPNAKQLQCTCSVQHLHRLVGDWCGAPLRLRALSLQPLHLPKARKPAVSQSCYCLQPRNHPSLNLSCSDSLAAALSRARPSAATSEVPTSFQEYAPQRVRASLNDIFYKALEVQRASLGEVIDRNESLTWVDHGSCPDGMCSVRLSAPSQGSSSRVAWASSGVFGIL
jgi:hypothetical protein